MAGGHNINLFAKWFDRLVKNKMGAAALPISGISVGYLIMQGSRIVPRYDEDVALLGLRLMVVSVFCFVSAMVIFIVIWTNERRKAKR